MVSRLEFDGKGFVTNVMWHLSSLPRDGLTTGKLSFLSCMVSLSCSSLMQKTEFSSILFFNILSQENACVPG